MDYRGKAYDPGKVALDCIKLATVIRVIRYREDTDREPFWCEPEQWISIVHQLRERLLRNNNNNTAPHQLFIHNVLISCREWHPDLFIQDGDRFIPRAS